MIRFILNVLVALSQLLNALLLGDPDETLSSRCGKKHPTAAAWIDRVFWFDPRHCVRRAEPNRGAEALTASDRQQLLLAATVTILAVLLFA